MHATLDITINLSFLSMPEMFTGGTRKFSEIYLDAC